MTSSCLNMDDIVSGWSIAKKPSIPNRRLTHYHSIVLPLSQLFYSSVSTVLIVSIVSTQLFYNSIALPLITTQLLNSCFVYPDGFLASNSNITTTLPEGYLACAGGWVNGFSAVILSVKPSGRDIRPNDECLKQIHHCYRPVCPMKCVIVANQIPFWQPSVAKQLSRWILSQHCFADQRDGLKGWGIPLNNQRHVIVFLFLMLFGCWTQIKWESLLDRVAYCVQTVIAIMIISGRWIEPLIVP